MEGASGPRFIFIRPKFVPTESRAMFLNSHNVNSNQNHVINAATHRSRKEKLVCRSIVTSEPIPSASVDGSELHPSMSSNHVRIYGRPVSTTNKIQQPGPSLQTGSHVVKIKVPRKSKLVQSVVDSSTNGTGIYDTSFPSSTIKVKLPKRVRIDSDDTSPGTLCANGVIAIPPKTTTPTKPRKVKLPKPITDKPKRKYTKRKNVEVQPIFLNDKTQPFNRPHSNLFNPNRPVATINFVPRSVGSINNEHPWLCPSYFNPSPSKSDQPLVTLRQKSPNRSQPVGEQKTKLAEQGNKVRDMRVPNSNTHLLLSPQTLKRMLRNPTPATLNTSHPFNEEEMDEEVIQASNSLFKDMSLDRQQKAPSQTGSSLTSSSTSTNSSSARGRGRYSRRKFGRLYPPFDPNHCCHPHCLEGTLTGSKYCGDHVNRHLLKSTSTVYGPCTYTDPLSLKPCNQTVYGEDEKEFRFCDAHSARVAATRIRMHQTQNMESKEETMETLLDELKKCIEENGETSSTLSTMMPPPSPSSSNEKPGTSSSSTLSRPTTARDDLSKEFLVEIDTPLPHHTKSLDCLSRFQPDHESDEDAVETDEHEPLKHAGYYSTDEVISIYRAKLNRLRSLYKSQFSILENAYLEFKLKSILEHEKNSLRKFTYTCDPKNISVQNPDLPANYKDEQIESRDKSLALMKYRHRVGARKVVQLQAKKEYEKKKTEERGKQRKVNDPELILPGETDSDEEYEHETPYHFMLAMSRTEVEKRKAKTNTNQGTKEGCDLTKRTQGSAAFLSKFCAFGVDTHSTRCSNVPLPLSKFCQFHILNDTEQVLFTPCGQPLTDTKDLCSSPMIKGLQKTGCVLHRLSQVREPKPSEDEIEQMKKDFAQFCFAGSDEEQDILEDLVAKETVSMDHFDGAVKYLNEKGFAAPDTDESESEEENEEEEEAFKNLLHEELKPFLEYPVKVDKIQRQARKRPAIKQKQHLVKKSSHVKDNPPPVKRKSPMMQQKPSVVKDNSPTRKRNPVLVMNQSPMEKEKRPAVKLEGMNEARYIKEEKVNEVLENSTENAFLPHVLPEMKEDPVAPKLVLVTPSES